MKRIFTLMLLLASFGSFAQTVGIKVATPIIKNNPADNTITGYANLLNGGYHTGPTYHSRDSLSTYFNKTLATGLLFYVSGADSTYRWNGTIWTPVAAGNVYTSSNGITKTGNNFTANGTITQESGWTINEGASWTNYAAGNDGSSTLQRWDKNQWGASVTDANGNQNNINNSKLGILIQTYDSKQIGMFPDHSNGSPIGIQVRDSTDRVGIILTDNYHPGMSANPHALIDRSYLDSVSVYTASNGLTKVGSDIQDGGAFTSDIYKNANGFQYNLFGLAGAGNSQASFFTFDPIGGKYLFSVSSQTQSNTHNQTNLSIDAKSIRSSLTAGNSGVQSLVFEMTSDSLALKPVILSDALKKGILYNWDDDSNLGDSSLVPKRYVDNAIVSGGVSAVNGLTKNIDNSIGLGGAVDRDTQVEITGSNVLSFVGTGGTIGMYLNPANPSITVQSLAEGAGGSFAVSGTLGGAAGIGFIGASASSILNIDNNKIEIKDDINHIGFQNYGNYHASYATHPFALPDVSWIDSTRIAGNARKADTTTRYREVWVDNNGNDATGVIGRYDKPYKTLQAAQDASLTDTVTLLKVNVGVGRYANFVLKRPNMSFFGSGKPITDAKMKFYSLSIGAFITTPTKLVGGTIIEGTWLDTCYNNIQRHNMGIDCGKYVTDLKYGGAGQDASFYAARFKLSGGYPSQDGLHQLQTNFPQMIGIIDENVSMLCRDSTTAKHANLKENCYDPKDINVTTYYGAYGTVFKSIGGSSVNGSGFGHATASLTIKSNDYAYGWGTIVTNYHGRNIKGFDSGGIYFISENSKSLEFPQVNGFQLDSVKYGFKSNAVVDGANITDGRINTVAGKGIYIDPSWAYGDFINIQIRGAIDTGVYFVQNSGSYRPTKFVNVNAQNGSKLGIFVNATTTAQVFFSNSSSTGNGGGGYNIAGNVYGGPNAIYTINNSGTAATGVFVYGAGASSDFIATFDAFGVLKKQTTTMSNLIVNPYSSTFSYTANPALNWGSQTAKMNGGNGAITYNRNPQSGAIQDATSFAWQDQTAASGTAGTFTRSLQIYNASGTQITAWAYGANGNGQFSLGANQTGSWFGMKAGTTTSSLFNMPTSVAKTTPVSGDAYFDGTNLFISPGTGWNQVVYGASGSFSGAGTATTTFTVTIGSTQANNTYKVQVTPTSLLGAAVFYVTNKTTTTFDVVYTTGLTGTLTFDWSIFK